MCPSRTQFVLICCKNVENKVCFEINVTTTITGLKNPWVFGELNFFGLEVFFENVLKKPALTGYKWLGNSDYDLLTCTSTFSSFPWMYSFILASLSVSPSTRSLQGSSTSGGSGSRSLIDTLTFSLDSWENQRHSMLALLDLRSYYAKGISNGK